MRKAYLDNIRWGTVLLVVAYHVLYIFNASGVPGGIGGFSDVQYQDAPMYFVYPWFMVLLFVVAGMSSRYALGKLTHKDFISARTRKLLALHHRPLCTSVAGGLFQYGRRRRLCADG